MNTIQRLLNSPDLELIGIYTLIFTGIVSFWSAVGAGVVLVLL